MGCTCNEGLGADTSQVDAIVLSVVEAARALFPEKTAEAEAYIQQRLFNYGVDYAKYKARQTYGTATELLSSPMVLLGLGLLGGYFMFKRR